VDTNEISTVTPMSSGSSNSSALRPNLLGETGSRKYEMATTKWEILRPTTPWYRTVIALFQSWFLTPKTNRYSRWHFVAIYLEYKLSCAHRPIWKLETTILSFALLVSFRSVVQHCHYFYWIVGPRKHAYSRWKYVPILFTNWDIVIYVFEV